MISSQVNRASASQGPAHPVRHPQGDSSPNRGAYPSVPALPQHHPQFYEHMYYFKESFIGTPITVTIEVSGLSEDGMLFMFEHNFYNHKGENLAYCEMQGAWIDLKARKLTGLPDELLQLAHTFPKSENYKVLTKEDTRKHGVRPKNITL